MSSETKAVAKRLFALSGNCCAFPNCKQNLVIENDKLIGVICHIEGENLGSARYNNSQTDAERNHFDNLIILCPTHHTFIDSDPITFTVEKLKEIKKNHERKFIGQKIDVSDKVLDQAILKFEQNINTHGTTPIITQTGNNSTINVYNGLNPGQVKETFEFLLKENYPKAQEKAAKSVEQRLEKFTHMFLEMANGKLTVDDIDKFSDPDFQFVLTNALITNARHDSQTLRENLSKLLIKRINSNQDLEKIVLDEAIKTIGKLTPNQIDILTLCFILKYITSFVVHDWPSFNEFLNGDVQTLLSSFENDDVDTQHLLYANCITKLTCRKGVLYHIQKNYPFLFSEHLSKEQITNLGINKYIMEYDGKKVIDVIFSYDESTNKYYFNDTDYDYLFNHILVYSNMPYDKMKRIEDLHKKSVFDEAKVVNEMEKTDIWDELFVKCCCGFIDDIELTSVGIAIAVIRLEEMSKSRIDLQSWISKAKSES